MDRSIVYAGELPRLEDFMGFEKSALYALGYLSNAVLGASTCLQGLTCAPTSPASLNVTVGAGSIYSSNPVDATAFGALGTDTNTTVKQGLLLAPVTLAITPPVTAGFSQVYLVQAAYNDLDSGTLVLPYYNATNPAQPFSGPNNSGVSQFTVRGGVCAVALKPGAAAATGSQTAPSVDPGYFGLYLITVANGATTITSANIVTFSGALFIPLNLNQVPAAIQAQAGNYAVDTGTANALAISLPFGTVLTAGMPLRIKKSAAANASAVTLAVNGAAPFGVVWSDGSNLIANDWPANAIGDGIFDGTNLQLDSPVGPTIYTNKAGGKSFLNSGSWVVPNGVTKMRCVRVWGAGGGGGGSSGTSQSSAGGGGGGYSEAYNSVAVVPGSTITVTIGAGGAGGIGGTNGSNGGTSTFGAATPVSATGGTGGGFNGGAQGTGGSGSGGEITANGNFGSLQIIFGGQTACGVGGQAPFASGKFQMQITTASAVNGLPGAFPGGGANGGCTGSGGGTANGGNGNDGLIIIEW